MVFYLLRGEKVIVPLDDLPSGIAFLLSDLEHKHIPWTEVLGLSWDQTMHGWLKDELNMVVIRSFKVRNIREGTGS